MNQDNINKKIVTRFAPSPTGFLHVGGIRTALYAWIFARKNNGTFILRIEDTDKEREVSGSIEHIKKCLSWLGLSWDEGPDIGGPASPYIQSERLDIYKKYAKRLIDDGFAYADPYSEQEIEEFRKKAEEEKEPFLYRNYRPGNPPEWDGSQPLRFKVKDVKRYEWNDLVYGDLSAGPEALDDFILIKSDGYPTYNFAHIVDDIEMGVTHIIRGQEFISSVPKFLSLYDALKIIPPYFATMPPIMAHDGKKKLGKRDGAKDALEYQKEGILPEAMFNFLALLGWHPSDDREIMDRQELIDAFELDHVQNSGAQFNDEKLNWVNKEYLKKLSYEEQEEYIDSFMPENLKNKSNYSETMIHNITPIIIERISSGKDIKEMAEAGELNYFFEKPTYNKNDLFFKSSKIEGDRCAVLVGYLEKTIDLLNNILDKHFDRDNIKRAVWEYADNVGRGDLLWPIRFALSGREKSPDPFVLAEIFGKRETIERLNQAIQILS